MPMLDRVDHRRDAIRPSSDPETDVRRCLCRGVTLARDGSVLVDHVSIDLSPVGTSCVIGPNGAGKSLLLRMMHGLVMPDSGAVTWGGVPAGDQARRHQAMVFQKPVLLRRSVEANLRYVLPRSATREAVISELLELVHLGNRGKQAARSLSGGEQQRLALARALAVKPKVLFLDEATASLDPGSVAIIETVIRNLALNGTKIIFVTHDLGQAKRLADDVVMLNRGRVEEHGKADAFFSAPQTSAGERFLGGQLLI